MLEGLLSNLENHQKNILENLKNILVDVKLDGLAFSGNAAKEIKSIDISNDLFNSNDKEMLEDLLLAGFNRFNEQASKLETEITQNSISNLLPKCIGDLF